MFTVTLDKAKLNILRVTKTQLKRRPVTSLMHFM